MNYTLIVLSPTELLSVPQQQLGYYKNSGEIVVVVWHFSHVNLAIYVKYLVGS